MPLTELLATLGVIAVASVLLARFLDFIFQFAPPLPSMVADRIAAREHARSQNSYICDYFDDDD